MHELGLAQGLVRQAVRIAAENDAKRIEEIVVRIGALAGVEADLFARAYEAARLGTAAEGAALVLEASPVEVRCCICGAIGRVEDGGFGCAGCGSRDVVMVAGDELLLVRLALSQQEGTDDGDTDARDTDDGGWGADHV